VVIGISELFRRRCDKNRGRRSSIMSKSMTALEAEENLPRRVSICSTASHVGSDGGDGGKRSGEATSRLGEVADITEERRTDATTPAQPHEPNAVHPRSALASHPSR